MDSTLSLLNFLLLETFKWLINNNFESYSFHFARYNIPFYALPFVNFFIINEMGVTIDDDNLLNALQQLKNSATYNAKGRIYIYIFFFFLTTFLYTNIIPYY